MCHSAGVHLAGVRETVCEGQTMHERPRGFECSGGIGTDP